MKKSILLTTSAIVMGLLTGAAYADTIRFWTTEYQPDRVAKQQAMAADFENNDKGQTNIHENMQKICKYT